MAPAFKSGWLFDAVFSEGPFAEAVRPERPLPNVTLLYHWREHGQTGKAYRLACRHLAADVRAYPLWMFAIETAVRHLRRPGTALQLVRRLHRCRAFSDDLKDHATHQLKAWAAMTGYSLDAPRSDPQKSRLTKSKPLVEAHRYRSEGRFRAAESCLEQWLRKNPEDLAAALLLMRVLTQDLKRKEKAERLLARLEDRPFVSNAFVEFARRSLDEWSQLPPSAPEKRPRWFGGWGKTSAGKPEKIELARANADSSLDGAPAPLETTGSASSGPLSDDWEILLAERRLGSAVALLERKLRKHPADHATWLKLAEVHAVHCGDRQRAAKIIERLEADPVFTPEQRLAASARLKEWRQLAHRQNS
jgi:tetratricopeptide (TPR) repeat protein